MNINGAYYPSIAGELVVYPGPIHEVTATVDNNIGTPYVEVTQTPTLQGMDILFAFFNMKGEQGETGNGIQSIVKTATAGLVDTYTITYTNGTTSTFNVTNGAKGDTGNGIQSIAKTGTSGLVDTYTITFTNGQTTTFTVTNGEKGDTGATGNGIQSIYKTGTSGLVDTYTILFTDGTTTEFEVTNGEDGTVTTDQLMEAIANQLPTDSASGSIASFPDGANNIPVKSLIAQITPVQSGTGDPAPDNIRPISGWTGANITRAGKNLANQSAFVQGSINDSGANIGSTIRLRSPYIKVNPSTTYTYTTNSTAINFYEAHYYDINQNWISKAQRNDSTATLGTPATAAYVKVTVRKPDNSTITVAELTAFQMEEGSTATDYEVYNGNTINVDWTDEAGTVYGGTLTYIGGGKYSLQVISANVDLGTLNWTYADADKHQFRATLAGSKVNDSPSVVPNLLCSAYKVVSAAEVYHAVTDNLVGKGIAGIIGDYVVVISKTHDASDLVSGHAAFLDGVQLVYELATLPDPIILDAEDVKTLLGDNNIFSDTGDVDVTYRADTALYIDKKLGA